MAFGFGACFLKGEGGVFEKSGRVMNWVW